MLLSDFPQEVIEQITERLSLEDKKACSLACKSWKEIFGDSLHYDLMLNRSNLKDIVDPPQDDPPPCLKTRFIVRNLESCPYTEIKDEYLYVLQQTFPNIKYLKVRQCMPLRNFGATADWNIWRSLMELNITVNQRYMPDVNNTLMKIILCLPLLRRLHLITGDRRLVEASLSIDDFETIHSHLKHLGHLGLCTNLLTLPETDIERLTKVSPATNMRSLEITTENTDHRWLCYFARKYPNLYTLDIKASKIQPETDKKRSDTIALFQQVPLPFKHLTTLDFEYNGYDGNKYTLFWDILRFHNIPLKHLWIKMDVSVEEHSAVDLCNTLKHVTEVYLPRISKTIESLYLHCQSLYIAEENFNTWNTSYNLAELYIFEFMSGEIDTILYAAPHLKTLELHNVDIKVKGELYNSNRFGLKLFTVKDGKITSDVLRFLSFHCRSLKKLYLTNIMVHGCLTTPGRQLIDISYTRLNYLYLEKTTFVIQDIEFRKKNIALITRPIGNPPPKQDYDPHVLPVIGSIPGKVHRKWVYSNYNYHMFHISSEEHFCNEELVPSHEETKNITENTTINAKTEEEDCSDGKYKPTSHYTKIKLGYVSHLEIKYFDPKFSYYRW